MQEADLASARKSIRLGLLSRNGQLPVRSGLNWGQRPGRNGNEAYIAIPIQHTRDGFFPSIGTPFRVVTDSGEYLTLVRRQEYGKALHSLPQNYILGLYFRARLGVSPGIAITSADLLSYGRSDIEIQRMNHSEFYLDFGVN